MGLNLKNVPIGKVTRKVFGALDPDDGGITHQDGPEGAVFEMELAYQSPADLGKLMADCYTRVVSDAKKRQKGKQFDGSKYNQELARGAINNWKMTVAGARALRARFDFSKAKPTDELDFDVTNIDMLAENSDLVPFLQRCFNDYEFWFPLAESQVKNSSSGPGLSSGG